MPVNIAASIRQRLLNKAKKESRPFQEVLQYYAMERFLYRVSHSKHVNRFVLKGALMLHIWQIPNVRATMDIDFLGKDSNQAESVTQQMQDILAVDVEPDGLIFEKRLKTETITEEADYHGIRVHIVTYLDVAKIHVQIDIGFDDIIFPQPEKLSLPSLLDLPEPHLWCYSRESVIAEKLEAMYKLGELNSRMKDFYDIWFLARQYTFDRGILKKAIQLTFHKRESVLSTDCIFFSSEFIEKKQVQWAAFKKRLALPHIPDDFSKIIGFLKTFLLPIIQEIKYSE